MPRTDAGRVRPRLASLFLPLVVVVSGLLAALLPLGTAHAATAPAPTNRAAATFVSLRLGHVGPRVRFTQRVVNRAVTGHYGPPTWRAVRYFQRRTGLRATGVVNYWTWLVLNRRWDRRVAAWNAKYARVMTIARSKFGDPYVYGAAGPSAFDCSGYTMYVYRHAFGRVLPHSAAAQYRLGQHISRANARPGDLVFFHSGGYIYHAAIWAGNDSIDHAARPGTVVHRERLWTNNVWFARFIKRP